jgi:hydroxymethylglutaryl-CoA lyase
VNPPVKILETPRDAMQGLHRIIPTDQKVELINALLQVGFDIVDIGSFVSSKAIPQMADTQEVLDRINTEGSFSKLFVLVVNSKGALRAASNSRISYLGFPFSPSPTFLKKNINSDFDKAWKTINEIQNTCVKWNKEFMIYFSMAFGNPYGDPDEPEIMLKWTDKLHEIGIKSISLSDITGVSNPKKIKEVFGLLCHYYPEVEFGLHLHVVEYLME